MKEADKTMRRAEKTLGIKNQIMKIPSEVEFLSVKEADPQE